MVDRYELVSPVGEGGMAQVWVARQKGKHGFEKLFAFKCIHDRFADVPAFRSMFLDEARIASAIEHPNVAQVFDLGEAGQMLYLVIEYVDGESLGALMTAASRRANASVPVPVGVALRIMADACAGVHAAHSLKDAKGNTRGVVHRDVSPQNILVSVKGDVKVIDFGIAHAKDRIGGDTGEGSMKGKIHYMAPEQALREEIGPFTDVFALGATLYRMLAGHPPFDGGNDAATLQFLLSGRPPTPLPDSVPPLIGAIVERALSRDPGDRYSSALAMQTAIEQAIVEEGYVPDVATWVKENASDAAQERRAQLATRSIDIQPTKPAPAPSFNAELEPLPERAAPRPAPPAAPPVTEASAPAVPVPAPGPPPARPHASVASVVPEAESSAPSIMDVRALVARAGAPGAAPRPASSPDEPARPGPASMRDSAKSSADPGERHAAPARDVPRVGPATKPQAQSAGARASGWTKLAALATVVALLLAGLLLLLPMIVRDRILASARSAGIDLTIERIGIGVSGISLRGLTARVQRVPGADLRAEEIFVTGFSAREVRVRGLDVKLDGHASSVGPALLRFYEESRGRFAGSPGEPRKISLLAAHVVWTGLLGEGTRLDASDLGTELESRGALTEDIRGNVGTLEIKTAHTVLGPWAGAFDRNPTTSRFRLLFDPPVPDGPSALLVWGRIAPPHLTVKIPRSPLARLGLRPADLGLPADDQTELELKLEGGQNPNMRVEGSGRLDLFGARLKALKAPVDAKVEGFASGMPGKPLDFEKTTATVGPFVANVTGTITSTDLGFRLDAAWRTVPLPCERLVRAEARSMGPIAAALQELAHTSGAARVTGTANASGLVKYDTKTPDEATSTLVTRDTCGLSLFGL
ncbi:MAG TPA: serine/threonine-protein kinase [Labilithrix sp.]|nr:serine/threonine-protein kinase [Labilithrix sp.]